MIGHERQAREDIPQIRIGVHAPPAATLDDRIDNGPTLASLRFPHEQPVLLAQRRRPDSVFYAEVPIMPSTRDQSVSAYAYRDCSSA